MYRLVDRRNWEHGSIYILIFGRGEILCVLWSERRLSSSFDGEFLVVCSYVLFLCRVSALCACVCVDDNTI